MEQTIRSLDDETAVRILRAIAQSRVRNGAEQLRYSQEIGRALADTFDLPTAPQSGSDGDLAREALLVVSDDPFTRDAIAAIAKSPARTPERYDAGATIAITTAALIVLQTHVRFERKPDGGWSVRIEKKPTSDSLLRPLIQKLLGRSSSGGLP